MWFNNLREVLSYEERLRECGLTTLEKFLVMKFAHSPSTCTCLSEKTPSVTGRTYIVCMSGELR